MSFTYHTVDALGVIKYFTGFTWLVKNQETKRKRKNEALRKKGVGLTCSQFPDPNPFLSPSVSCLSLLSQIPCLYFCIWKCRRGPVASDVSPLLSSSPECCLRMRFHSLWLGLLSVPRSVFFFIAYLIDRLRKYNGRCQWQQIFCFRYTSAYYFTSRGHSLITMELSRK